MWFQNQDCWSNFTWCPKCQFELQEPSQALQHWPTQDPLFKTSRWKEAKGLTEEKAAKFIRENWMEPQGGPEPAEHLDVIVRRISQGPSPPPGLAPQSPPGSGGPPPAPRETTTTSTSASPAPSRYSSGDLERRVNDLSREVERQNELLSRYMNLASNLQNDVQKGLFTISELTKESRNLREENNKYKDYVPQLCMVMDDVIALRRQVASLEPLKDQVRDLEQELDSLRREVIIPAGTFDSAGSPPCSPRSFAEPRVIITWEA